MATQNERLMLLLELLDGTRDAGMILSDILTEEGDRNLAEWARSAQKKSKRQTN